MRRRPERRQIVGPILHFRGEQGDRWRLSAVFVVEGEREPPDLRVDGVMLPVPPRHLHSHRDRHLWRFDFAIPRQDHEHRAGYGFPEGERWYVTVPARGQRPRIAYVACDGAEDEAEAFKGSGLARNTHWAHLNGRHRQQPFHLLVHGGDQLYADSLWHHAPALEAWAAKPRREKLTHPLTATMRIEADDYYFDLYLRHWRQPEVAAMLAAVPAIMTWDDHDIFDGWGSHRPDLLACPVFQGVFAAARRHFALFQLGMAPDRPAEAVWGAALGNFCQGHRIGDVGLLTLDLRSERTPDQVLSDATWQALPGWLERFAGCRHLLVLSSVPLVFVNLNALEQLINVWPGQARFEDDLRDQWRSYAHEAEWVRLLRLLGDLSARHRCQVTVLSGEIHLGAAGVVRGPGHTLWQLISSGIVHPPPPALYVEVLERLARGEDRIRDGLSQELLPFAETGRRFIRARNWLSLEFDEAGFLIARWHVEGEREPYVHTIAPP